MLNKSVSVEQLNDKFGINISKHLGIIYTELGNDFLCGKMPVDHRTQQPLGLLHGGASVVLAESLGSLASNLCVDFEKQYCVGIEVNANHLKSATSGFVYGKAQALHLGKRTHVWEIKITNDNQELVCVSRLTVAVMDRK
jgi:1,4-dihydroxy-2-naphthoyl-CoA hydrolase